MQDQSLLNLAGLLLPFFIDLINKKVKDSDTRRIVSMVFCSVVGIFINFVNVSGDYTGVSWSQIIISFAVTITSVMGMSQLVYKGIPGTDLNWEQSDLRDEAGLNAKTN